MDYANHYKKLVLRAIGRKNSGYTEKHHIVPKCLGGEMGPLVSLTPEEHYVAHQLLTKMFPENSSLVYSLWAMGSMHYKRRSSRLYGWAKRKYSETLSRRMIGNMYRKGVPTSSKQREVVGGINRGKNLNVETKIKMSISRKSLWAKCTFSEKAQRLRNLHAARPHQVFTKETSKKMSFAQKKRARQTTTCPHCNLSGKGPAMQRWHFDHCKNMVSNEE